LVCWAYFDNIHLQLCRFVLRYFNVLLFVTSDSSIHDPIFFLHQISSNQAPSYRQYFNSIVLIFSVIFVCFAVDSFQKETETCVTQSSIYTLSFDCVCSAIYLLLLLVHLRDSCRATINSTSSAENTNVGKLKSNLKQLKNQRNAKNGLQYVRFDGLPSVNLSEDLDIEEFDGRSELNDAYPQDQELVVKQERTTSIGPLPVRRPPDVNHLSQFTLLPPPEDSFLSHKLSHVEPALLVASTKKKEQQQNDKIDQVLASNFLHPSVSLTTLPMPSSKLLLPNTKKDDNDALINISQSHQVLPSPSHYLPHEIELDEELALDLDHLSGLDENVDIETYDFDTMDPN